MLGPIAGLAPWQWLPLLFVATPLTLLWAATLWSAGRRALREGRAEDPGPAAGLDGLSWLVLLLLSGWFGAVLYAALHFLPRLLSPLGRRGVRPTAGANHP